MAPGAGQTFHSPVMRVTLRYFVSQSLADLGLPVNGADGIFLQMNGTNGWAGDFAPLPEAW